MRSISVSFRFSASTIRSATQMPPALFDQDQIGHSWEVAGRSELGSTSAIHKQGPKCKHDEKFLPIAIRSAGLANVFVLRYCLRWVVTAQFTFAQIASQSLNVFQKTLKPRSCESKNAIRVTGPTASSRGSIRRQPRAGVSVSTRRPAAAASLTGRNAHKPSRQSTVQVGDNRAGFSCLSSESKRWEAVGKVSPFSRTMATSYPGRYCWLQETHSREWL